MFYRARHTRKLRGFNLIEAAIVLAVVGFVIGGIWYAAAAVNENMKINKAISRTFQMIEDTRRLNKGFTPNQISTRGVGSQDMSFLRTLYNAGVVSNVDFKNCVFFGSVIGRCSGTDKIVSTIYFSVIKRNDPSGIYILQQDMIKNAFCVKYAMAFSSINFSKYQIEQVWAGTSYYTDSSQITLSNATSGCSVLPIAFIQFLP